VENADPPFARQGDGKFASVTVSMAEETSGILSSMPRVIRVAIFTSRGSTSDFLGTRRTSSNVIASPMIFFAGMGGGVIGECVRRTLRCR
jgi:hypothetical protein